MRLPTIKATRSRSSNAIVGQQLIKTDAINHISSATFPDLSSFVYKQLLLIFSYPEVIAGITAYEFRTE